jgi:hypothetical protein
MIINHIRSPRSDYLTLFASAISSNASMDLPLLHVGLVVWLYLMSSNLLKLPDGTEPVTNADEEVSLIHLYHDSNLHCRRFSSCTQL